MTKAKFMPLEGFVRRDADDMQARSVDFLELMKSRRTVRLFKDTPVPQTVIENAIKTGATAPSGANKQPWHFVAISSPEIKHKIRLAAEEEERAFYGGKAGQDWLDDLEQFGTDEHKPFLETAPWLIAVFKETYGLDEDGGRSTNYYVHESAGLAAGFFLAALHNAGLATLTHTPSPMGFLNQICERPKNEKPIMLVVAGYPTDDCAVPVISKKPFDEISTFL